MRGDNGDIKQTTHRRETVTGVGRVKHCQPDVFRERVAVSAVGQDNGRAGDNEHTKQITHGCETE